METSTAFEHLMFNKLEYDEDFEIPARFYQSRDIKDVVRPHRFTYRVWHQSMNLRYFIEMTFFLVFLIFFQYNISAFNKDVHLIDKDVHELMDLGVIDWSETEGKFLTYPESFYLPRAQSLSGGELEEEKKRFLQESSGNTCGESGRFLQQEFVGETPKSETEKPESGGEKVESEGETVEIKKEIDHIKKHLNIELIKATTELYNALLIATITFAFPIQLLC